MAQSLESPHSKSQKPPMQVMAGSPQSLLRSQGSAACSPSLQAESSVTRQASKSKKQDLTASFILEI